jgi:hypothetical protein
MRIQTDPDVFILVAEDVVDQHADPYTAVGSLKYFDRSAAPNGMMEIHVILNIETLFRRSRQQCTRHEGIPTVRKKENAGFPGMIVQLGLKFPAQRGRLVVINHVRLGATGYVRQSIDERHVNLHNFSGSDPCPSHHNRIVSNNRKRTIMNVHMNVQKSIQCNNHNADHHRRPLA